MRNILLAGLGGFVGAILRYVVAGLVQDFSRSAWFPFGTLAVNVFGCLLIGVLGGWADNLDLFTPSVRVFVLIGILGGFTTYSTFGYETMALIRDHEMLYAFTNVALHLFLGLGGVWLGYSLSTLRG